MGREHKTSPGAAVCTGGFICAENGLPGFGNLGVDGFHHAVHGHSVHRAGILQGFRAGSGASQAVHTDGQEHINRFGILGNDFAYQRFAGYKCTINDKKCSIEAGPPI